MTCTTDRKRKPNRIYYPHVGNLFTEFFNTAVGDVVSTEERKKFTNPATNVIEHDDRFELEMALPGFTKEDLEIKVVEGRLSIKAKEHQNKDESNYRLREWNYTGFAKHFRLSDDIDSSVVNANINQGVLHITLGKKKEAIPQPPKVIKIK